MQLPRTPVILSQTRYQIKLAVGKLSFNGEEGALTYFSSGDFSCTCKAFFWAKKKMQYPRVCGHQHLVTIICHADALECLHQALDRIKEEKTSLSREWMDIRFCQYPMNFSMTRLYCKECPLFPDICNRILITSKGRKPLIWKLQSALFNGRRKDAIEHLENIINQVEIKGKE